MFGAFFNSFRKGPVVCCSLDIDLSGKVAIKTTLTWKRGRHAHNAITVYDICHRARLTLLPLRINT